MKETDEPRKRDNFRFEKNPPLAGGSKNLEAEREIFRGGAKHAHGPTPKLLRNFDLPQGEGSNAGLGVNDRTMERESRRMEIGQFSLVVRDYDEAIAWFTQALSFELIEDTDLGGGKRWVVVAPPGGRGARLLLAKAATPEQQSRVGNQTGGRVFLFLYTDEFDRDFAVLAARGVTFVEKPRSESYGKVVVFEDLYGNRWDFIERRS